MEVVTSYVTHEGNNSEGSCTSGNVPGYFYVFSGR